MTYLLLTAPWNQADLQVEVSAAGHGDDAYPVIGEICEMDDNGDWRLLEGTEDAKARSWLMHDAGANRQVEDTMWEDMREDWNMSKHSARAVSPVGRHS